MQGPIDLPDINIWLAVCLPDHPHHRRARAYWDEESGHELAFCRITSLGFLRLATHRAVTGDPPLTVAEAWRTYNEFRSLPEVIFVVEPEGCEQQLAAWATAGDLPPRLWTDAYLAAFALSGGLRLISFDRDFQRFRGLEFLHLTG